MHATLMHTFGFTSRDSRGIDFGPAGAQYANQQRYHRQRKMV